MMNYICTWFCADEKGEESIFPQTGQKSSGYKHQQIYWRCIVLLYATSVRFNKNEQHLFFTNVRELPLLDGRNLKDVLTELQVQIIFTDFKYKTPKGYFQMFQNQFYEFSILEYIAQNAKEPNDQYLIIDSDCVFTRPAAELFELAKANGGFISFEDDCSTELVIHGLSRKNMKVLYQDLLGKEVPQIPGYHLGEFFLANTKNVQILFDDFKQLWPNLINRYQQGLTKFNEEAQTLSYLYYKNGFHASNNNILLKRIWTNPVFYRNVDGTEADVMIWHLPAEKTFGLADLYKTLIKQHQNYGFNLSDNDYRKILMDTLGVPHLSKQMKLKYYLLSYYRASTKRISKKITKILTR